jgi:ubiquinone/menaquinone biosynthesis C-methylase UbiE
MLTPPQGAQGAKLLSLPNAMPNYFADSDVAARYAKVRPFFHDEVVERLCRFTGVSHFRRALDVGCGSGQSSIALAAIADHVIAIDASQSMLNHARVSPRISYQLGCAEQLDFSAGEFDLVSVGSALHWFDQDRFFAQCRNVLAPAGVLAVYNDHFTAHMQDVSACKRWMRTRFAKRYPAFRRGMRDMDEFKAAECGFEVAQCSSFNHLVGFSREEFIAYLLTSSNTLAAIRTAKETYESSVAWLDSELTPILPNGITGWFIFKCNIWLMRLGEAKAGCEGLDQNNL